MYLLRTEVLLDFARKIPDAIDATPVRGSEAQKRHRHDHVSEEERRKTENDEQEPLIATKTTDRQKHLLEIHGRDGGTRKTLMCSD